MRRSDLLLFLKNQLEKINATYPIYEVLLHNGNVNNLLVSRTLLIEEAPSETDIVKLFDGYTLGLLQANCINKYERPEDILQSNIIDQNSSNISLNWRGRLYKWDDIKDISDEDDFNEKVLASYWRFIITKKDANYFSRHEISPTYYNPGHSTGGTSDYRESIKSFIKYMRSLKERGQIDSGYDRIVFFGRVEPTKTFTRICPAFYDGSSFLSYYEFEKKLVELGEDNAVEQIYQAVNSVVG